MSNPFEKYVQATFRQNEKLESAKVTLMDTTLQALAPNFDNITKPNTGKSAGDLLVDAAASALKIPTIVGGVAVGAADLALSAASKPIEGYMRIGNALAPNLIPEPMDVGYGYIAKGLHDTVGYDPERAKQAIDNAMFSDARKIQEKEYQSGYTAAEDKAFQDSWISNYQAQVANLQKSGATEQQLKDFTTGFNQHFQQAATQRADKYQTSWDKPLSENIDIIGHGFNNLLENPSLALGGAIESAGYLLPSMAVSRGVMALEKAANVAKIGRVAAAEMAGKSIGELAITRSPFLAAGIGEGSVSGLTVLEQMRSQMPDGIAGGRELLGALGVAASTGLIGTGFGKAASKVGIGDIDSVGLGRAASQAAAMKLPALARPVGAVTQESAEEFAQTFGESIIPNVTMGKDPLEGLGQELPLGTMAGAIMGAGMNAPSLVSGGFSDISSGLGKAKDAVTSAASLKSFDTLSNPEHKNYNPAQAFNIQLKNLESNDETVRTQAEASVSKIETDLNTARASVEKRIKSIQATLKAMPPSDQTTDAQKLEIEALGKEYSELTTKSSTLADQYVAFLDAQVTAQEHRDVQQGTQFTEEQAKADIATLTQPIPSQTVWSNQDTDIPVEVIGEPEVDEQGNEFTKVRYTPQEGADPIESYVPTSELVSTQGNNDVAQQEALDHVTRHFSKYSNDDLDLLATSPILSEAQRNSLRLMSKSKRELAAVQDPSQVFDNILNGYKGKTIQESHRGLNQYTDMVNTAVATKNEQLASLALDGLGAFTDDHTAKRDAINEAFGLVQKGTYKEIRVVRTEDGTWGFVPFTAQEVRAGKNADGVVFLEGKALKAAMNKVGGFNVHINSNTKGAITQINNETQLIQDRFDALSGVAESFVGVTPKPVETSTAPTIDTPVVTESSQRSPKLEEAYKETFSKPIENWDANDFASVGAQATHLGSTFDSKTIDADNAFSQKMAKKIIADGIAKNRSTADIMQDVMFVAYSPDFAMSQSGVSALNAYIELRKAQGTSTTPIVTEPSDTTAPVDNPVPEAPVQSDVPTNAESEASINVWAGSNENAGLSNLATRPFTFGTKKYQSVEHAYQTLKSGSFDQQTYDKYAGTENKKIAGNRGTKTTDNANVRLMEKLMTASFEQNKDAMQLLQKTGDAVITHTQDKSIWGKEFPRILMEIRKSSKAAPTVQPVAPVTPTEPIETVADSEQQLSSLTKTASDTVKLPSDYGQSDIFKAVPLFKKENPTGIIAFRVNSKRTLLESLKDANAIGNPFNWQNPKIGAGNATKMFDEWLRTGKHTDHAEAPQATEEYRQAILSKLKENPTAKILYYKELNGASHANVLERIAKGMQQTATPTKTKTPVQAVTPPTTPTPSQDTSEDTEEDEQAPKIGDTSTEVKGRFTITKTVVSDNTVLSVHTNNEDGEVTKSEYVTTYPDIYSDEFGDKYTVVIYRDSTNPSVITDVKSFNAKDKKNTLGSYGKAGTQTDEQYITTFTEAEDVTLEYTDKFEKPLAKITPMAETKAESTLEGYTNHSGGAIGADTVWGEEGKALGVKSNHYRSGGMRTVEGSVTISSQDLEEGKVEAAKAAKRNWGYGLPTMKMDELIRNWAQVKYADAIFAIGTIVAMGEKVFPNQPNDTRKAIAPSVAGGTGYAVGMAINHNKPVYVYNQTANTSYPQGWFLWDAEANNFLPVETPTLTKNFAGIGTRNINQAGKDAIKSVYANTLAPTTKAEPEAKIADTTTPVSGKAKDVVAELKQSHSGLLSTETKGTLDTLLDLSINLFPDTLIQFIKDVSQIPTRLKVTKFTFGKTVFDPDNARQANVFINPEGKVGKDGNVVSDLYETIVHEFIHAATVGYLNSNFEGTQYKTLLSLVDAVNEYLDSQPNESQDSIVQALRNIVRHENPVAQVQELLAYGLTHSVVSEWAKVTPYAWSTETNKGISDASQVLLDGNTPKTVYDALLAVYGNIIQIEERNNALLQAKRTPNDNGTTEGGVGGASDTNDTSIKEQSAKSDGGTGTGNVEVEQTSTESQEVTPLKPEFQGKVILAHAGTGKSFATKSNPDLIDGDVLYYQATNTIVDKYNEANNESVPNIENVTGTRGVFEAWGEYDKSNPERQAEAVRRRDEVYAEYAKQARALADAGKTVLSSSIREELIAVADMVVIQNDAKFIAKNLTSAERVNQNSETDLVKIQGKIDKAKNAASKNPNLKAYTLEKEEYISDLIFEEPAAPKDAKVTVLQGVTDEVAAEERKKPFNLRNILKGYFTQSTTKEDATGANPLVTVANFIRNFNVRTQVSEWVNDRRKPTEKQLAQVEHFQKFHAEFSKALKFVFNTQASAIFVSNKENLVGYLEMGKKPSTRELDENVVTALALSAYSYLIKQGNKVMNTNEELETLFRLKKGVRAPLEIEQMFRFAGQEMPIVVKALGTDTAKALGLKVREDQDPTLQDRLNTALGILAMEAMAKAGFIVIDTLEGKPLTDFLTAIKTVRESKAHTSEDEYDFEVDTDAETEISKFTMVRPNALMEGESKTVFDGNRPVLTEGLPTLNSPLVNELIEANKDTKGFLSYLFGVDVGLTTPLKEIPKKFSQKLINGTDASVPSVQAELLTEAQKHSFTMRTNTVAVFAAMQKLGENSQFLKELLGIWIDDHVLSRTHVTERDSLQAKAQNDWTAVLNGLEWAEATLDEQGQYQEFYDTQFVAQNQRQHLKSNMFSAQSSQIHRAMAALTGFSTTIDLSQDEQGTVKDEALLNLFYQAVGEGLEGLDDYLKADILSKAEAGLHQFFTVDKVYGDYYVPALKAFLQTEDSQNAIKAMRVLIETGTIDATQQKAIAWFVEKGEMGAQSLQSLIALAELDIAQANGTTFTTTIGFGSDGVNHGVSAANMLTGVISKDMRQQTGIFPIAEKGQDQISNMQEVYKRKITDYYVDFGKVMSRKLRDLVGTLVGKLNTDFVQGMTALFPKFEVLDDTGELKNLLDMRKIAKIWAIPFNYSAGKAALQRALARGFLAGIYGNMNKLANEALDIIDAQNEKEITAEQLAALDVKLETVKLKTTTLQDNLNKVLRKYGMSVTLPEPQLLNEEAQGKLSKELENTLMQAAIDLHGEAAWQATEEFAKDYLQVRNVYTEVEKASFTLFDVVRNQLIEEKKANRKFTNTAAKVQVKGKTVQYTAEELNAQEAEYFDLTKAEMAEVDAVLAAMRPMFNTALSVGSESTNAADSVTNPSGVSVRKHKMQREPAKGLRAVNTFYLKEIDANRKPFSEARNIGLTKEVAENAGVASSANAIQSIDAFVAAKVQAFMDALNVHDAAIFGLKDFLKGVKKQNEEHLKALTNYQLGLEHAKMLVKVYQGYKAFMATQEEALKTAEGKVKENIQRIINEAIKEMDKLLKGEVLQREGKNLVIGGEVISKGGLIPKLKAAGIVIDANATIEQAIGMFIEFAINQDAKKLGILKDTFGIHQFAGEGGMHQLTDENRASITEQEALVNKAKEDLQAELKDKTVEQVTEVKTPEAAKEVSPKITTAEKVKPKEVPVKPMPPLVKLLRESKGKTLLVGRLLEQLKYANETLDAKVREVQLVVLNAITPLIDSSIEIYYSSGIDNDYEGYGFFDKETNTIHINSDKEAEGAVKASLVIHELLHAALANRIETLRAAIKSGSTENSQAIAALKNLDALRESLLLKITDPVLRDMLKDTDEFISYGLTDSRLQKALLNTSVSRNGRGFGDNWRKFVAVVGRILNFGTKEISALAAFAHDTAALLDTIGTVAPIGAPTQTRLFSTQSAEDLVNGQSSLDIMTALPHSNTGAFNQQLDRLIVEEIGQLYNQDDAAKARIDEIQTLTASDALNAGFSLSRKEQYVQQALQYAVAAYMKLHAGGANVGQLRRVYHAAKAKMDVTGKDFHEGDWATATQQERDIAKAKYDFMFDSTKEGYMSRFVSMALASESVSKILDIALPLTKPETQDKTWFETVNDWVSYVMAWLTNKYVRLNPTLGASNQLIQLMDNLVKLDIRNRQEGVALHQKAWNTIGLVTTPLNKALKGAGGALLSGVGLRESRFLPVRALGAILVLRSEEAAKAIPKMIIDMRNNQLPNTKLGEVANILLEASGVGTLRDKFDVLIRQTNLNAKNRQDIVDNVKKAVNTWFKAPLTKAQHAAVAYGLLGTDAQALLENYSVEDIVNMALHEGKLNAEIAKLKKEIAKNPNGNDMLNAAEQLGYYMVTRIGGEGLVKNALGIAIGLGTQYFTSVEQADPKLVGQLNTLVSMLAMTHVPNSDKAILAALYKTDAEGIHATIQLHNGLVNDSLKDFQANPLNMVKGWMPEVTNPYLEIKAANSMVERQQMEAEGWVLIDELKRDKHDKGSPKYLMKHNDIGYQRLVSGAVDLGSTARSGTEAISRTSPKYLGITQARYQNAARRAAIPNGSFDPSKQPRGLIAAYDTNGMALAYNYEMDNETRDAHLDRKHNIGDLLGTFGGLNYYKPEKAKQSNTVAEVLFEDYKANYSQNPNAYLKISHKSTDPKVVEMWRMLPQDFRQRATELYGKGNPIIIRNEAFNLAFGFKKFSVVSYAFDAVKAERERIAKGLVGTGKAPNAFQSGFVRLAEATRKGTAQADFAKAEHVVQEIVKAIKDFIVIRSGTTMMWNIFANVLMLMANGINPVTIVKDWVFAVTNVRAYQKLNSQLIQAQADLAGGKDPIALKQRIGALKAELKANVMNPYINAGLLSSIVEDVNIQQGEYTYTSAFKQTVDEKTQWIPKPVKTAAAVLTIAPSTKLYQFLATTTQLSDFVAKYSMSKHLQANGTDINASIIEASKTFINYDVPTSQGLQYANDMGLFMFTKFFLRIQAVLMKLLGKRAGSVIAQHLLVENLTGAEGILSPMAFGHIGNNPIESSVLGLPSAFFSIGTVDAVTDVGTSF